MSGYKKMCARFQSQPDDLGPGTLVLNLGTNPLAPKAQNLVGSDCAINGSLKGQITEASGGYPDVGVDLELGTDEFGWLTQRSARRLSSYPERPS